MADPRGRNPKGQTLTVYNDSTPLSWPNDNMTDRETWRLTLVSVYGLKPQDATITALPICYLLVQWDRKNSTLAIAPYNPDLINTPRRSLVRSHSSLDNGSRRYADWNVSIRCDHIDKKCRRCRSPWHCPAGHHRWRPYGDVSSILFRPKPRRCYTCSCGTNKRLRTASAARPCRRNAGSLERQTRYQIGAHGFPRVSDLQ